MEALTVMAVTLLFWAFLAVAPVLVQRRWGLWAALIATATEAGLLILYGSMPARGLPDGRLDELIALWFGLWAALAGGGLATFISLVTYIRNRYGSKE